MLCAAEYLRLAGLTIKGLRKLGYTGLPCLAAMTDS